MIITIKANGDIVNIKPEVFYQGSTEANKIYLIAPLSINSVVELNFTLPNLHEIKNILMTPSTKISDNLNTWVLDIPASITQRIGLVKVDIIIRVNDNIITVNRTQFEVKRGAKIELPEEPEINVYEQIVEALSQIHADIVNKVNISYTDTENDIEQGVINNANGLKLVKTVGDVTVTFEVTEDGIEIDGVEINTNIENRIETHNTSGTAHADIRLIAETAVSTADEAKAIALSVEQAKVFDTFLDMETWLKDEVNKGLHTTGLELLIKSDDVPDYWVTAVLETPNASGYYYEIEENEATVLSVNDKKGIVVLKTDDISDTDETNKWSTAEELAQIATNTENIEDLQDNKADDNTVVKLSGNQNIAGVKTFEDNINIGTSSDNAELNIKGDLKVAGDIYQQGSTYETHAEQVYTTSDEIILRDNAESGLQIGEKAGLLFKKYDGTNDGVLKIDKDGVVRVGDVGDEQPLTTREETPIDKSIAIWDNVNSKFKTNSKVYVDNGKLYSDSKEVATIDQIVKGLSGEFLAKLENPKNHAILMKGKIGSPVDLYLDTTVGQQFKIWRSDGTSEEITATVTGAYSNLHEFPNDDTYWVVIEAINAANMPRIYVNSQADRELYIKARWSNLLTSIKDYAFEGCSSLQSITIPNSVTIIGNQAFQNCSNLTSITLPVGLKSIQQYAFAYCSNLISITIPSSVTSIEIWAFRYCLSLETVVFEEGSQLTSIEYRTFANCSSLTTITIPSSVTSIGNWAFDGCSSLTEMTILATTPPTLSSTNAISAATTVIYVPYASLELYKTAPNWSTYADRIFPIPDGEWITEDITAIQANYVTTDTAQDITGEKTFESDVNIGTAEADANLTIKGDLNIAGDIIQDGSTYETHAEQIYTTSDEIILRDGAVAGLSAGALAKITAKLYDGTNDGVLGFDNNGIARVGDVGSEQAIATREDTPTDTGFARWDSATNKFITETPDTTPTAGSDKLVTSGGVKTALDGKATTASYTATLPYTSWTGSSAPYSKEVTVSGILATDKLDFEINFNGVYEDEQIARSNFGLVYKYVTSTDKITFYANAIPTADIPLTIKVVR